jgi:plastocyanin
MPSLRASAALAAGLLFAGLPARGAELSGRVVLFEKGRATTDPSVDARRAVVWFEPETKAPAKTAVHPGSAAAGEGGALQPVVVEMATVRKQFHPQVLVVPVGSTVRFPNQDPILHNVFSVSGGNAFDLGLVGAGKGKQALFKEAGVVRVFCNVHHAMFAHVVVVSTPHYTQPGAGGAFRLDRLPAGRGTLRVWHERGEAQALAVTLPVATPLDLRIEVTQPRVPPHKNKQGKSYSGGGYG